MIGVIANPRARLVARDPGLIERLRAALGDDGIVVAAEDPEVLENALVTFRSQGCDLVATCGGDGTNVYVLTQMARIWDGQTMPRLALLRGGTINIVAENLGIRGRPDAIFRRLLASRRRGTPPRVVGIDLLRVGQQRGFIFGSGLPSRFLEAYYQRPNPGHRRAISLGLRALASALIHGPFVRGLLQPIDTEIRCDGQSLGKVHSNLLLATTMPNIGLGLQVGYRARERAGSFHALAFALNPKDLWAGIIPAVRGRSLSAHPLLDTLAQRLEIRFPEPVLCLLDGETFPASSVIVEVEQRVEFELS